MSVRSQRLIRAPGEERTTSKSKPAKATPRKANGSRVRSIKLDFSNARPHPQHDLEDASKPSTPVNSAAEEEEIPEMVIKQRNPRAKRLQVIYESRRS
jgi:hypothetical protein